MRAAIVLDVNQPFFKRRPITDAEPLKAGMMCLKQDDQSEAW